MVSQLLLLTLAAPKSALVIDCVLAENRTFDWRPSLPAADELQGHPNVQFLMVSTKRFTLLVVVLYLHTRPGIAGIKSEILDHVSALISLLQLPYVLLADLNDSAWI